MKCTHLHVLHVCHCASNVHTGELAKMLRMSRSTTISTIVTLMRKGWIERKLSNKYNVVCYTYHTTEQGVAHLKYYANLLKQYNEPTTTTGC